jgi:hypothetical protein
MSLEDAALQGLARADALLAQRLQLLVQLPQFGDACGDMADVLVEQSIDLGAIGLWRILESQQ